MKNDEKARVIQSCISEDCGVKVYSTDVTRAPLFGKFVICNDSEQLAKKGMYRFVTVSNIDNYNYLKSEKYTSILTLDAISSFKKVYHAV